MICFVNLCVRERLTPNASTTPAHHGGCKRPSSYCWWSAGSRAILVRRGNLDLSLLKKYEFADELYNQILLVLAVKAVYNISPFHPLAKYPGPLLWRASRLPASIHHARGDLYQCIAAAHREYGKTVRIAPDELSFSSPEAWPAIYNSRPQLQKTQFHFGKYQRL